ncbi:MAG TPA: TRAP transporter permease DctQ [Rhodocyclaceae bacterium]|nr:TRAP transporter permease DctQ [Rhodocyclaceae bacterium]
MLRRVLTAAYDAAGYLAALFMVATLAMVLAGIVSRLEGVYFRGADAYAGYCMAAAGFLALAYTFKHGEHIRVSLVLERLSGRARRSIETLALALSTLAGALLALYSVRLAWQSWIIHDVSQAVDASPLWIPQLAMAAGSLLLLVALADDLFARLSGREPSRLQRSANEAGHAE